MHLKFLKQLLEVQTQTHNIGTLLETGRVPLMAYALKNCIKNWNRIAIGENCNPLTHLSFRNIVEEELEWYKNTVLLVNNLGVGYILQRNVPTPEVVVYKRIVEIFHQKAFANTRGSSLQTDRGNLPPKSIC